MTDLISIFSSIILLATVSTLAIALFAYTAYKVRERRKPEASPNEADAKGGAFHPIFLRRFLPADAHVAEVDPPAADPPETRERSMRHGDAPETQRGTEE